MGKPSTIPRRHTATRFLLTVLLFSALAHAQNTPKSGQNQPTAPDASVPVDYDGWGKPIPSAIKNQKPAPAPRWDISGTWDPANGPDEGGQFLGAKALPVDGKPGHEPPFTPLGLEAYLRTKPSNGARMVPPGETNDPELVCDPQGFPREDLFQLRTTQIVQDRDKIYMLYEFDRVWRVIWTDGRELPKDPEPRWYGYSVGKWTDDYTLVVETNGTDDRTWVDHAGRPHTADLRVRETFHRVDRDHLEWTVQIDDPQMYTKPWLAMDKFPMRLLPPDIDVREMICSRAEFDEYDRLIGNPASDPATNPVTNKDSR